MGNLKAAMSRAGRMTVTDGALALFNAPVPSGLPQDDWVVMHHARRGRQPARLDFADAKDAAMWRRRFDGLRSSLTWDAKMVVPASDLSVSNGGIWPGWRDALVDAEVSTDVDDESNVLAPVCDATQLTLCAGEHDYWPLYGPHHYYVRRPTSRVPLRFAADRDGAFAPLGLPMPSATRDVDCYGVNVTLLELALRHAGRPYRSVSVMPSDTVETPIIVGAPHDTLPFAVVQLMRCTDDTRKR